METPMVYATPALKGSQRLVNPQLHRRDALVLHATLCTLTCVLALCFGAAQATYAEPFKPNPISDESYGESFTAIADLSDGSYVLLQYVFTNAGFGDGKAACRGLVVRPGEPGENAALRVDRDEWSYSKEGSQLKVGACVLSSAQGRTRFRVKTKELSIDLTLSATPKRTKPPGHHIKVDDDEFYESELLIPWANAEVKVNAKSGRATLSGMGYLDHSRSNTRLPKVAARWLRFRGFQGSKRVLLELRDDPSGKVSGWRWVEGEAKPSPVQLGGLKVKASLKEVSVALSSLSLKTSSLIYRYRPAKEWGVLGRLAKPWVGDPETRTFKATLTLPDGQTVSGILEHAQIAR